MEKKMKRFIPMFLLLFTLLGVLLPSVEAKAGAKLKTKTIYSFVAPRNGDYDLDLTGDARLKKVKISNKKVLSFNMESINYYALAPGKSTITYYVSDNGETKVLKQTVFVVRKYPFKSFKIDGKDVTSLVHSTNRRLTLKKGRHKITWKLASGYKLINAYSQNQKKNLKNGAIINVDDHGDFLSFYIKDDKGHKYKKYYFYVGSNS